MRSGMTPLQHASCEKDIGDRVVYFVEARVFSPVKSARTRHTDIEDLLDSSGTRRHDDHAVCQQHRLIDGMGDEYHGLACGHPEMLEVEPHLFACQRV